MAKRPKLEDRLRALHEISFDPSGEAAKKLLRKELASASSYAVAAAANIAGEHELHELGELMPPAFERFREEPFASDPGCTAKTALMDAMAALSYPAPELYLDAIHFEQWEPVYSAIEPLVETAGPVRGACGFALVGLAHPEALRRVAVLLADPHHEARIQAIRSLQFTHEHEAAAALLRFKATIGDDQPAIQRECLATLLTIDRGRALPFVAEFLAYEDLQAESAALALGESRLSEAFPILQRWHEGADRTQRAVASLAIATLRSDEALDYLFALVEEADTPVAIDAIGALAIYASNPAMRERAEAAAASSPELTSAFKAAFG